MTTRIELLQSIGKLVCPDAWDRLNTHKYCRPLLGYTPSEGYIDKVMGNRQREVMGKVADILAKLMDVPEESERIGGDTIINCREQLKEGNYVSGKTPDWDDYMVAELAFKSMITDLARVARGIQSG